MKNKLLNIIKLIALSTVMVSGGFARLKQIVTPGRILNAGAAAACYAYGSSTPETKPRDNQSTLSTVYTSKTASFVFAAAFARNAISNPPSLFNGVQKLVGANLIYEGSVHSREPELCREIFGFKSKEHSALFEWNSCLHGLALFVPRLGTAASVATYVSWALMNGAILNSLLIKESNCEESPLGLLKEKILNQMTKQTSN